MSEVEIDKRASVEIELEFPFTLDGADYVSVTMRRPKVRDSLKQSKSKGNDLEKGLHLMADLCELPVEVFYEMDEVDLNKISDQYSAFTGRRAETPES